jgi:hypothetical protein
MTRKTPSQGKRQPAQTSTTSSKGMANSTSTEASWPPGWGLASEEEQAHFAKRFGSTLIITPISSRRGKPSDKR